MLASIKKYNVKYNYNKQEYIFKIYQATESDIISYSVYNDNNINNTQYFIQNISDTNHQKKIWDSSCKP